MCVAYVCVFGRTTEQGGGAKEEGFVREKGETKIRWWGHRSVRLYRGARYTRIFFFFFNFYFPQTKEAPIRWRWWPCARWSCILSQGQSVSRIQRLSFVSFLFHHRARRDTAAKKHRCIFPPEATTNCLRFLKHFNLVESICWNYSPRYIKGKQMTNISSVCFLIIKHVQVFSEWINENVRDRN